jgi:insulysin
LEISDTIETTLKKNFKLSHLKTLLPSQLNNYRHVKLPENSDFIKIINNDIHQTKAVEVYLQCDEHSTRSNVVTELFCQIIFEPAFTVLRTQEQLGYFVGSGVRRTNGIQGVRIMIQSDKPPDYLDERIECFLSSLKALFENLSEEQFKCHVDGLAVVKLDEPKNIMKQCDAYWKEIESRQYNFERSRVEFL